MKSLRFFAEPPENFKALYEQHFVLLIKFSSLIDFEQLSLKLQTTKIHPWIECKCHVKNKIVYPITVTLIQPLGTLVELQFILHLCSNCLLFNHVSSCLKKCANKVAVTIDIVHSSCCRPELGSTNPRSRESSNLPRIRFVPFICHH